MRRNRPGKLRPGRGEPAASPAHCGPAQRSGCHSGWGAGRGLGREGGDGLAEGPPGRGPSRASGRGPSGPEERWGPRSARRPLTWRAGVLWAELAATGAAARLAQSRPLPRGGGGEAGREGPRPARDPAPGGLEAALGAGALCLDASGAPRAPVAVPAPPAPAPLVSGSPGSRSPAGAGMGRGLRAPPLPDLSDGPGEPHRGRALGDCPGLRVSRLSAPLSRRAFPWRAPGRPSLRETKEAAGGGAALTPGPPHRAPPTCPLRPAGVLSPLVQTRPLAGPTASRTHGPGCPGMRGRRRGPRGEFT